MKILKPGKVEQRKFVCPECGCVFVSPRSQAFQEGNMWGVICPQDGCGYDFADNGEPYEEPTQSDEALLADLIHSSRAVDFDTAIKLSPWLIANGVTFREE